MESMQKVGSWAFIIGLIIAIVAGVLGTPGGLTVWVLAVLGLVVGIINVTHSEAQLYLVASIAFLVSAASLIVILPPLAKMLTNIIIFVGPSAAVVALRALYDIAKEV